MKTVYKYHIEFKQEQIIKIPVGFQILAVKSQMGTPCIWALVDSENPLQDLTICVYGTGEKIVDSDIKHVGTFLFAGGNLVFHVFSKNS